MANKIIDVDAIAAAIGVPKVTQESGGRVNVSYEWTPELLRQGLEFIRPTLAAGGDMTLTGSGIHWMMAAFAIAMGEHYTLFQYPQRSIAVYDLKMGEENPEGKIHFDVCDAGDTLYVDFDPDDYSRPFPMGPHNYEMERLPQVAVPPCRPDQHVCYSCKGAFNIFLNIVKTYAGACKSISVSPGHGDDSGYICVYSACDEKRIGDKTAFHHF